MFKLIIALDKNNFHNSIYLKTTISFIQNKTNVIIILKY